MAMLHILWGPSVPCSNWCFPMQCGCFTTGRRCCTVKPLGCRLVKGAVHPNLTHKAELNVVTDRMEPRWQQRFLPGNRQDTQTWLLPLNTTCFSVCCDLAGCFSADWSWKDKNKVLRVGGLQIVRGALWIGIHVDIKIKRKLHDTL